MSRKLIDLTGQRFGRWTVLRRAGNYGDYILDGHTSPTWLCRCDCGAEGVVTGNNLRMGKSAWNFLAAVASAADYLAVLYYNAADGYLPRRCRLTGKLKGGGHILLPLRHHLG